MEKYTKTKNIKIEMINYKKHWLELIFAGENWFPTTKNCLSFQKYAVSVLITVKSILNMQKNRGFEEK